MVVGLFAAPITREQARKNALEFLKTAKGSRQLAPVQNRAKLAPRRGVKTLAPETELYYVFNRGNQEGYVIVSGDDLTLPVLGYTDEGEFDYNNLPENMRWWLDSREEQLLQLSQANLTEPLMAPAIHDRVEPMVTTKWNQGSPYNDECPNYFTLGRSVTGCVATAMAQVMYYQRAKSVNEVQKDIPAYDGNTSHTTYGKLHVEGIPAGSPIDWENMLDTYGSANAKQKKAVAQLMHYCGVAVKMDYTNSSSGAYSGNVASALVNYFGYGSSVKYVTQSSYNEDAWDKMLYNELAQGRPFYLSGQNTQGGHAFVCDGYDGNRCFHINWGWGGSSDGYFLLTSLNPSSQGIGGSGDGYSTYEEAVIGFEPENYGTKTIPISNAKVKTLCLTNFDLDGDGAFTYGEAAQVTDLGDVFKGQTALTTFEELYYFTSLKSLPDEAFSGCTKLTSVKLPKSLETIGKNAFANCRALKTLALPDGMKAIGEGAFSGCRVLTNLVIPNTMSSIENSVFESCLAFTKVELPTGITYVGDNAFKGCTKLATVTLRNITPEKITLGEGVFADIDLSEATLNVPQGTGAYIRTADQWKEFGDIHEERNLSQGKYATLVENQKYFIYNVGTGGYLTRGEAWGTQAVVADTDEPMRFQIRRTTTMPEGTYSLSSTDTGSSSHILFRTSTDSNVGNGVNACFVDGESIAARSYWKVDLVEGETNVYTFQIPSNQSGYKEGQYLGIQPSHSSNAASPTYGAYSDVEYADYTKNCQWMLVAYNEEDMARYQGSLELQNLLTIGKSKRIDIVSEQAVYDNLESTVEDMAKASRKLRRKMNFINFADSEVRQVAVSHYDADRNGELSYTEAAAVESVGTEFYQNPDIIDLTDLKYLTKAEYLSGNAFTDCSALRTVTLPDGLLDIYYRAFMNDKKLETVVAGSSLKYIGDNAFDACSSLREFRLAVTDPATIQIGENAFRGVTLSKVTLYVPYGTKALYEKADTWKNFGEIKEMRAVGEKQFVPVEANKEVYVYNLDMRKSIEAGEAYGTQAVVGVGGLVYQLKRSANMAEGLYYLSSSKGILFRTSTDSKVGAGVKTCFVDGSVSSKAYWKVVPVEGRENIYTLQVPETDAEYVEGEYLGTDLYHKSNFTYGTYGLYYDVTAGDYPDRILWGFVGVDETKAAKELFEQTERLKELLAIADAKSIDDAEEHAVYDNFESTEEQINGAIMSLRSKLHYIEFADSRAHTLSVNRWDEDEDGELSLEEAAAITDLSTTFRSSSIRSLDELRYFTSLTTLGEAPFRGCSSLMSLYIPANVKDWGTNTFQSCSNLKYIALLGEDAAIEGAEAASLTSGITAFVAKNLMEAYAADEAWTKAKATIKEYTGVPTVTAEPASRQYGRANPKFTYEVTGAPINGEPTMTTTAETASPIGNYPIIIEAGTITTPNLACVEGVLTVERAPLTLTAKSYTRNIGEENPEFAFSNSSLRNREKIDDILLVRPTIECDATADSPGGVYEIRIFGAEADNYEISYVNGTLTVIDPDGIAGVNADAKRAATYDLSGRRISNPKHGVYISGKKKLVK